MKHIICCLTFLGLMLTLPPAMAASMDRQGYLVDSYAALPDILRMLHASKNTLDPQTRAFAGSILNLMSTVSAPPLVFVDDQTQFVIPPSQIPRLMRAPDDPQGPIFVNRSLLNSEEFNLDLLQLLKLLLHELGHKTGKDVSRQLKIATGANKKWPFNLRPKAEKEWCL